MINLEKKKQIAKVHDLPLHQTSTTSFDFFKIAPLREVIKIQSLLKKGGSELW